MVYLLEATPTVEANLIAGQPALDHANMWCCLTLLMRRMSPFLRVSSARGEWLWHCVTLTHFLVLEYFKRISRERMLPCVVPQEQRLSLAADECFVRLMMPLVNELIQVRGAHELMSSLDNLARLSVLSSLHSWATLPPQMGVGLPDPFGKTVQALLCKAAEVLSDPGQSDKHVVFLQCCSTCLPAMLLCWPVEVGNILPIILSGIDATDAPKTLMSCGLIVNIFMRMPCIDTCDWTVEATTSKKAAWRWPIAEGCKPVEDGSDRGACITASLLPNFAVDLVERVCDYVARIPKPAKGRGLASAAAHFENSSLSVMHGALCLVVSQCDPNTYERVLEIVQSFICSNLLLDQVKPMGILLSAVLRSKPEVGIPTLLKVLLKKLLPQGAAAAAPMHEAGFSESEAVWYLSATIATVRYSGSLLLGFKKDVQAAIKAALADERDVVLKLGAKLLRRTLFSLTSMYINCDWRVCSVPEWTSLLTSRGTSGTPIAWPLQWYGAVPPWWTGGNLEIQWHVPQAEEVEWARQLSFGILDQVGQLLASVPKDDLKKLPTEAQPQGERNWLAGFRLPEKKKASCGILVAKELIRAVLRGTQDLWPDERSDDQLAKDGLPVNLPHAEDTGSIIFDWLADTLLKCAKALSIQERSPDHSSAFDQIEVPKVLRRMVKCIGELLRSIQHAPAQGSRLFPSAGSGRHGDAMHIAKLEVHSTVLDKMHSHSRWRDVPRAWWVSRVAEVLDSRHHARLSGHRYVGVRKELLETLCSLSIHSGFAAVRQKALEVVSSATKRHVGAKSLLLRDVILPSLRKETQAMLQCGALTGEAADREQQRLNETLLGITAVLAGGLHGLISHTWRRGADDASAIALALSEAIHAATKPNTSAPSQPEGGQRCEVKASSTARLIGALKYWLESREIQCWVPERRRSDSQGQWEADEEVADDGSTPAELQTSGKLRSSGRKALEACALLLDICGRSDCHWRAQVMATTAVLAIRSSLGRFGLPAGEEEMLNTLTNRWAKWLLRCLEPKSPPALHTLGVHGLLLLIKKATPATAACLQEAGVCEINFIEKLLSVIPPIHHTELMNSGEQSNDHLEPTHDSVTLMSQTGGFRLWPRVWMRRSSRAFAIRNALFWQTYFGFVRNSAADRIGAMLQKCAEYLTNQPVAEAEFHTTFCELFAGALRALRKEDEKTSALRSDAWASMTPWVVSELRKASQPRLEDWCDAMRFIAQGASRPLLKGKLTRDGSFSGEVSNRFITPLLNFAAGAGGAQSSCEALECTMEPIRYEGGETSGGAESSSAPKEGSSFDAFKRLRLLMALLVEPAATKHLGEDATVCLQFVEVLRPGLGHPYKQLREEVARALFLLLRAAGNHGSAGLVSMAENVELWIGGEAERLLPILRSDNSAQMAEKEGSRSSHVVESSGLCYVLLHAALSRLTVHLLPRAVPRCLEFLLAAAVHADFELRVLAHHALALCCSAHPQTPAMLSSRPWATLSCGVSLRSLLDPTEGSTLPGKEREKALGIAIRPVIMASFFILSCGSDEPNGGLLRGLHQLAEASLGCPQLEERVAAKSVVASFLNLATETQLHTQLRKYKTAAGPVPKQKPQAGTPIPEGTTGGVLGLSCALLAAADCGVPPWTGKVVETLAPYGRQVMGEALVKEVQGTIQAFLKLMQANQQSWKECQRKLTPSQLDLLSASKGKLSYFS